MTRHNFVGYHTCKSKGGYDHVRKCAPFLSGSGKNQWLSQGYYFWTDSDYWAKQWGRPDNRVIGKFIINLCMKTELLDLVGNVEHSIQFEKLVKQLKQSCETEFTVNQAIAFLRKLDNNPQYAGIFPYKAVKAEDNRYGPSMCFIDPVEGKSTPTMRLKKRQQMCVFKEAKDSIQLECFVEPQHFVERFNKE